MLQSLAFDHRSGNYTHEALTVGRYTGQPFLKALKGSLTLVDLFIPCGVICQVSEGSGNRRKILDELTVIAHQS